MADQGADMFTFSGDSIAVEVAGASSALAQAAGDNFVENMNEVSGASMDASNNLPNMVDSGLSLA